MRHGFHDLPGSACPSSWSSASASRSVIWLLPDARKLQLLSQLPDACCPHDQACVGRGLHRHDHPDAMTNR